MRTLTLQFLIALLCLALPAVAKSPFAGTWEGSMNDQPALKLTTEDTDGKIAGTMLFYFQRRGEDGKFHVVPNGEAAGPIISPQVEGKVLTFEVQHHRKHGGTELGPNIKYRVEVTGANDARLRQVGDPKAGEGLKLTRKESPESNQR